MTIVVINVMIAIIAYTEQITITVGVLMKSVLQNMSQNERGDFACFAVFQRAIQEAEGRRGDRGL